MSIQTKQPSALRLAGMKAATKEWDALPVFAELMTYDLFESVFLSGYFAGGSDALAKAMKEIPAAIAQARGDA